MNNEEKQIVGNYRLSEYYLDTGKVNSNPTINLMDNKTFVIHTDKRSHTGSWYAKNYGDFVLIYFEEANGKTAEGEVYFEMDTSYTRISMTKIVFGAPSFYFFPEFKKMTFSKIDNK